MNDFQKKEFAKLFEKYHYQILRYIVKKISDVQTAEDLAMDVFVSCYQKYEQFDPEKASFQTWLYVIVNNKIKNYYRDHKINDEIDESIAMLDCFEDEFVTAEYLKTMRTELAKALKTLPELQRKIVLYKYFAEKNANEIAEIVGLTAVNVRVNLTRALKKLKEYFEECNVEWEI